MPKATAWKSAKASENVMGALAPSSRHATPPIASPAESQVEREEGGSLEWEGLRKNEKRVPQRHHERQHGPRSVSAIVR